MWDKQFHSCATKGWNQNCMFKNPERKKRFFGWTQFFFIDCCSELNIFEFFAFLNNQHVHGDRVLRCADFQAGNLSEDLSVLFWSVILPVQHPHLRSQSADPKCVGRTVVNNPGGRRSRLWMKEDWSRWFDLWWKVGQILREAESFGTDEDSSSNRPTYRVSRSVWGAQLITGWAELRGYWPGVGGGFYPGQQRNPIFCALCGYRFGDSTKERGRQWLLGQGTTPGDLRHDIW